MSPGRAIATLFEDIASNMLQSFEGWDRHVPHPGEKGGIRERRVQDFLEKHLPDKYGVASGHIIDRGGQMSLQEDIVIFDRMCCPVLKIDPYYQVFPCETVYAAIEVKSVLNVAEIRDCIRHTHKLGQLYRGDDHAIECCVFAYDSYGARSCAWPVWARNKFRAELTSGMKRGALPSVVLCLKKGFVLELDLEGNMMARELGSGALLYWLDLLVVRLSTVGTSAPRLFVSYGWEKNSPIRHYL